MGVRHNGKMSENFHIERTEDPDGPMVQVGPVMPHGQSQLQVPTHLTRRVFYGEGDPVVEVSIAFSGERLEVVALKATATTGSITSLFLTQLALPKAIRQIAIDVVPNGSLWTLDEREGGMGLESSDFLAQLYWFEHLSWGSPRGAIMKYMGWSRTTANWHIRKVEKVFPLPGRKLASQMGPKKQSQGPVGEGFADNLSSSL